MHNSSSCVDKNTSAECVVILLLEFHPFTKDLLNSDCVFRMSIFDLVKSSLVVKPLSSGWCLVEFKCDFKDVVGTVLLPKQVSGFSQFHIEPRECLQ